MAAAQRPSRDALLVAPANLSGRAPQALARVAPAWIISGAVHIILLLLFFQITLAAEPNDSPIIEPVSGDVKGEDPDYLFVPEVSLDPAVPLGSEGDRPEPPELAQSLAPLDDRGLPGASVPAPMRVPEPGPPGVEGIRGPGGKFSFPGSSLPGSGMPFGPGAIAFRAAGAGHESALKANGGTTISEAAVAGGLRWLALHQANDGRWSLDQFNQHARHKPLPAGPTFIDNCTGQATRKNDIAGTAFGLLPFLGAGMTHKPGTERKAEFAKTVQAGLNFLLVKQGKDGYFGGDMYSHGLAAIAVCEAYGLTSDPLLKSSAQRALNYIVEAQDPAGGGWRYARRTPGDTSVTGWQIMALKSGQMAGLAVPVSCVKKAEQFLDTVESTNKGGYCYVPGAPESVTMTAVALLCRQYLGVSSRNAGLRAGVKRLQRVPPGASGNLYYEYYATQVMFHMGGESWNFWNLGPDGSGKGGIRETLIKKQDQGNAPNRPRQKGSWGPEGTGFDKEGGRLMATSLSLLSLEVYYRYLPLYGRDPGVTK